MGSNQMARLKQFCFYVSCDINMQVRWFLVIRWLRSYGSGSDQ
jgi:hypothetical protein